jgi:hypothetical protein
MVRPFASKWPVMRKELYLADEGGRTMVRPYSEWKSFIKDQKLGT